MLELFELFDVSCTCSLVHFRTYRMCAQVDIFEPFRVRNRHFHPSVLPMKVRTILELTNIVTIYSISLLETSNLKKNEESLLVLRIIMISLLLNRLYAYLYVPSETL